MRLEHVCDRNWTTARSRLTEGNLFWSAPMAVKKELPMAKGMSPLPVPGSREKHAGSTTRIDAVMV